MTDLQKLADKIGDKFYGHYITDGLLAELKEQILFALEQNQAAFYETDTKRLDWLENEQCLVDAGGKEYYQSWEITAPQHFRGSVREAIDAAMRKEKE